MSLCVSIQTT